jgi:mRNA-degrading endonuclease HigB of HigAB toxin-antitoxin module
MKIFTEKPLVDFIESNPKYRIALQDWRTKVKESEWECFDDITKDFENIEQIDKNTFIFSVNNGKAIITIKTVIIGQFVYIREFLCIA